MTKELILWAHQKRFLEENPDRALLAFEVGTGKTICAVEWMKLRPTISFLVVCPKQILKMWKGVVPPNATVVTKEQYKKYTGEYSGIVVDECDQGFGSSLFTKGRSAMATTLYNWVRAHDTAPVLLLSATVIRNSPHTSHTLLTYIQKAEGWKEYRAKQYALISRPYQPRPFYSPVFGWQKYSAKMIRENASVASLSDIVDVPTQYEEVVTLPKVPSSKVYESWHDQARVEGLQAKLTWLRQYAADKRKIVIVCRYLSQITHLASELAKDREVFVLTGATKDQEQTIKDARDSFECFLICQSSLGAGFELPEFSQMIFVSLGFAVRDLVQMKGRVLRINALKSNWYTYLIGGKCDESVYKRVVIEGQDFVI